MRARARVGALRMQATSREAAERLESQGLSLPERPKDEDGIPTVPVELSDMDDTTLMELYSRLVGWANYISTQIGCAKADERAAEKAVDKAQAKAMVEGWSGKATERVAIAKARFLLDPASEELVDRHEELKAYRELVETLGANVDRSAGLVSREITRRTSNTTRKGWGTP